MKTRFTLTVLAVLATIGFCLAYNATYAHASTVSVCVAHPSARNCPAVLDNQAAWEPALHPSSLYMGNGHAPYITGIKWPVYQHSEAKGHGILHTYKTACLNGPNRNSCKQYKIKVSLLLNDTKFHCGRVPGLGCQGGFYYDHMRWTFKGRGFSAQHRWSVSKGYWG